MIKIWLLVMLLISAASVQGYARDDVVQISPDTYMISREDHGGIFGNAAKMKLNVIRKANEFAESKGKVAICISIKEIPMRPLRFASIEYQFKVVDKNDQAARGASMVSGSDVVTDKTEKPPADIQGKSVLEKQPDLYTELVKLDELRKKGLINDVEFEGQKKILLDKQR